MSDNAQNNGDTQELAKTKRVQRQSAYKDMQSHLQQNNDVHTVYVLPQLSTLNSRMVAGFSSEASGESSAALLQVLRDQVAEGIECHFVGPSARGLEGKFVNKNERVNFQKSIYPKECAVFCLVTVTDCLGGLGSSMQSTKASLRTIPLLIDLC